MSTIKVTDKKLIELIEKRDVMNKETYEKIIALQLEEQEVKKDRLAFDTLQIELFPHIEEATKDIEEFETATDIALAKDGKSVIITVVDGVSAQEDKIKEAIAARKQERVDFHKEAPKKLEEAAAEIDKAIAEINKSVEDAKKQMAK